MEVALQFKVINLSKKMASNQDSFCSLIQYNTSIKEQYLSIIEPLVKNMDINFGYTRIYYDGAYCDLRPEISFLRTSYERKLLNKGVFFLQESAELKFTDEYISLWPTAPTDPYLEWLYESNIWQGFEIYEKKEDYIEIWTFGAARERKNLINFYINKFFLFKKFIHYFREKGAFILNGIDKNSLPVSDLYKEKPNTAQNLSQNNIDNLIQSLSFNQYKDTNKNLRDLSKREIQCLLYFSYHKTAKETARLLDISHRTVEAYLENLKIKLKCHNKSELNDFILKNQLELNLHMSHLKK
jgi:DNA-binding CsgD family transcriptional regulator